MRPVVIALVVQPGSRTVRLRGPSWPTTPPNTKPPQTAQWLPTASPPLAALQTD